MKHKIIAAATIAAISITGASALENQNVVSLVHQRGEIDDYDIKTKAEALRLEGRNGIIEYKAAAAEHDFDIGVGVVIPVGKGFGVSVGVNSSNIVNLPDTGSDQHFEGIGTTNEYLGIVYDNGGKFEGRVEYGTEVADIEDSETITTSGRYYLTNNWGVEGRYIDGDGFDAYEVGISYKF